MSRFEKYIGGKYLGELVRLVMADLYQKKLAFQNTTPSAFPKPWSIDTSKLSMIEESVDFLPNFLDQYHFYKMFDIFFQGLFTRCKPSNQRCFNRSWLSNYYRPWHNHRSACVRCNFTSSSIISIDHNISPIETLSWSWYYNCNRWFRL